MSDIDIISPIFKLMIENGKTDVFETINEYYLIKEGKSEKSEKEQQKIIDQVEKPPKLKMKDKSYK